MGRKEFFHYPETAKLFDLLEETSHRSGVSRAVAYEDFLTCSVAALSGGRMEDLYLQTIAKHTAGPKGKRGCDSIAKLFAELVAAMEQDTHEEMKDILGDLHEGAVSYGEHSQYMTPMPLCRLMARLALGDTSVSEQTATSSESAAVEHLDNEVREEVAVHTCDVRKRVLDCCCGSGRMLLAAAQINRHWELCGQDVDLRLVRCAALNLAFRNLYGYIVWGNTLALEQKLVYRTGFDGRGFLREIPLEACPAPVQREVAMPPSEAIAQSTTLPPDDEPAVPKSQLRLF